MKKILLLFIPVLLLNACIGIESTIQFNRDGSGRLSMAYKVSQYLKDLGSDSGKSIPLPISRESFQRTASAIDGLKLNKVSQREDEENVYIEAILTFERVDSVNGLGGDMDLSLTMENDEATFTHLIFPGLGDEEISPDSLQMIETFFKGYELKFIVEAPDSIRSHSLGDLSQDGKSVTYKVTIPELLQSKDKVVLQVSW